jgi:hypothetical protein
MSKAKDGALGLSAPTEQYYGLVLKQEVPSPYTGKMFTYDELARIAISLGMADKENMEEFFKRQNYYITVRTDKL